MTRSSRRTASVINPEMHHVAVGDDIFLAFQSQLAGVAGAGFAVQRDVIGIGDGFGPDKALFEIGMNHAGRRGRLGAAMDGPGAGLLRAHGEIGDEIEQLVAGADQAVEAGLLETQRLEKLRALLETGSRSRIQSWPRSPRQPRLPSWRARIPVVRSCCRPW